MNLKNQNKKKFKKLNYSFSLVKAKVNGFFLEESQLSNIYPNIKSIQSLYAYTLRNYKIGKINKALEYVNKCIEIDSKNPYFHELKGQILFENGRSNESVLSFREAISLKPNEKSFNLFLAKSLYHSNKKSLLPNPLICYGNMSKTMIFHMKLGIIWDLTMEKLKNMIFLPTLLLKNIY